MNIGMLQDRKKIYSGAHYRPNKFLLSPECNGSEQLRQDLTKNIWANCQIPSFRYIDLLSRITNGFICRFFVMYKTI